MLISHTFKAGETAYSEVSKIMGTNPQYPFTVEFRKPGEENGRRFVINNKGDLNKLPRGVSVGEEVSLLGK